MLELQVLHGLLGNFQPTNEQAKQRKISLSDNNAMKEMKSLVLEILRVYSTSEDISNVKKQFLAKCRY